jgi:oligopeptide transport system substrate-binding protein
MSRAASRATLHDKKGESMKTRNTSLQRGEPSRGIRITRRDFLKIGGTGLAGATLLGAVPGCGVFQEGGGQQGGGGGGNSISVWMGDNVRDLNSTTTTDSASTQILDNVMEGLHRLDPDENPVPAQAESVEVSDDGLTYTFTLRDGIKWSNGDPVTSQDFKYAWLRAVDPDTAGQYSYILTTFIKGADEFNTGKGSAEDVAIETPDDKTLRVTLVGPSPFWLGLTSFFTYYPQNQKFVEEQSEQYAQNADALIYNGPYTLTQFESTQGATVVKNEDYWDAENVAIQKVEMPIIKETDTGVNLYQSGELDNVEIEGEYVTEYRGSPDFYAQSFFVTWYLVPQLSMPIFQNKNILRAFQMSFDTQALVNKILNNGSEAATGYIPIGMAGPGDETFREAQGPVTPEYDPEQAKELFQKGVEEVGENPTIEYLSYDDSLSRDLATFLQQEWNKMGAKITVNVQPFDRALDLQSSGDFQLSQQGWIADYNDPMTFLDLFEPGSPYNTSNYENERYGQLISDAREEPDEAARMKMLLEAERILVEEDAAIGPIYFEGESYLLRPSIKNWVNHKYGGGIDLKWWKLEG